MFPCNVESGFDGGSFAVLELKCYTAFVPLWMVDLVRAFNLQRTSFSKYSTALRNVFSRDRNDGMFSRSPARYRFASKEFL